MRRFLIATLALSLAGAAAPATAGEQARKSLRAWLGSEVSFSVSGQGAAVEYCPDNTCERLTTPFQASMSDLEDFAFLYLLTKSGYVYLKDTRPDDEAGVLGRVMSGYRQQCSSGGESPELECVLKLLHRRAAIRLYLVRHDEGLKCTVPEALLGKRSGSKTRCVRE